MWKTEVGCSIYVHMGYAVVDLDGVAIQVSTVDLVARASAILVHLLDTPNDLVYLHLLLVILIMAMLAASSVLLFLTNCSSIGMTRDVKVMDSTLKMLSLLLLDLSMALVQLVMLLHAKWRLRHSWLKPLIRPQVISSIRVVKSFQ
nr:hypothetical protein CFP56_39625 [Quercus suber]